MSSADSPKGSSQTTLPFSRTGTGGVVARPDAFEKHTGLKVYPSIFQLEPLGPRIILALEPIPEEVGTIVLPDRARDSERSGAGWVLSCGEMAFGPSSENMGSRSVQCLNPRQPGKGPEVVLYLRVIIGQMVGRTLMPKFGSDEWGLARRGQYSQAVLVTDTDLWAIDWQKELTGEDSQ